MSETGLASVVHHLRRANASAQCQELTDHQLLASYHANRNEDAFTQQVKRHGAMVFGLCRRMMGHVQEAEDVFQATFLVLAQKSHTIRERDGIGGWLYRVAYRIALRTKSQFNTRKKQEMSLEQIREPIHSEEANWDDVKPVLDDALSRLPKKYQAALVLCDLEARTQKEAAQLIGCPESTLSSRLYRGREILAAQLSRKGVAITTGGLVALLSARRASAQLTYSLLARTAQGAVEASAASGAVSTLLSSSAHSLAQGALQMMFQATLKKGAILLVVGCLVGSGVLMSQRSFATGAGVHGGDGSGNKAPASSPSSGGEKEAPAKKKTNQAPKGNTPNDGNAPAFPFPGQQIPLFPGALPPGVQIPAQVHNQIDAVNVAIQSANQAQRSYSESVRKLVEKGKTAKSVADLLEVRKLAQAVELAKRQFTEASKRLQKSMQNLGPIPAAPNVNPNAIPGINPFRPIPNDPDAPGNPEANPLPEEAPPDQPPIQAPGVVPSPDSPNQK